MNVIQILSEVISRALYTTIPVPKSKFRNIIYSHAEYFQTVLII